MYNIIKDPDIIRITTENPPSSDTAVETVKENGGLSIYITAKNDLPRFVTLRWKVRTEGSAKVLGDVWERSYGDLEWRGIVPERIMPWYFLCQTEGHVYGFGVKVRPSAMCHWQLDREGITLTLDVRNGARGVKLNGRRLLAATVVYRDYFNTELFSDASEFCSVMCDFPILPKYPVYGGNNWYYSYGVTSESEIIFDAEFMSALAGDKENRPCMVIDDGWSPNACCGPWDRGNERFPDMAALMQRMKDIGVHPGLWIRPLTDAEPPECAQVFLRESEGLLDPSSDGVLNYIASSVKRISDWGCEIVKYDFTAYDTTGIWGKDTRFSYIPKEEVWGFSDPSVTTAEVFVRLYTVIKEAAGEMMLIGCNCVGHLCAGLVHMNRTGDDTSGRHWERTRFMGINTLAFRLCQNNRFFAVDADCVGATPLIPWSLNRQWLDLLSKSATPLFVSCRESDTTDEMKADIRAAFDIASVQNDTLVPVDWMENTCPTHWKHNGNDIFYNWIEDSGIGDYE